MEVFVRVAECGSFSRAAESLDLAKATLTTSVSQAEEEVRARMGELRGPLHIDESGESVRLYGGWKTSVETYDAVTTKDRTGSAKVRAFMDFVMEVLDSEKAAQREADGVGAGAG